MQRKNLVHVIKVVTRTPRI